MSSLVRELRREDPPIKHGNMLTAAKIAEVEECLVEYSAVVARLEKLIDGEPAGQPPGERRIALERLLKDLRAQVTTIQELWS